ncbi:2-hydroxyacyl-CoA dehydratase family protein [Magnetospirillum sp. 15-1]|uniref:2-hydroxyacyl-CoA dehydratase subunit D n=1 Tax=Magnetospirillum sp. 15-1 TaxID=1979370 RepID=UPI00148314B1|nr:2-hydroxyacyl-CoA dehydratase family protein [Magnetospirillum sp. 15-1]
MSATSGERPGHAPVGHEIVGRGSRESARLMRKWFASLTEAARHDKKAAFVFVMGNMNEVLRTFDMPIVFPEITALQTAVRGTSEEYLKEAEDYGFSPDVCGYVKADIAMHLRGGGHPMGLIPKPGLVVATNACNTYFKWGEIWERLYDAPVVTIDVPNDRSCGSRTMPGDKDFKHELAYVVAQIKELISECERVTGKKFDIDKFREHLRYANTMSRYWKQLLALNERTPAVFNALTDGLAFLGMANCFRATEEGATFFKELYEEMEYRSANNIGSVTRKDGKDVPVEQKFRLGLLGVPCYSHFRGFAEFFSDWGGVFVISSYLKFASGGTALGFEFDLDNPIESYAEGILLTVRETQQGLLFNFSDVEDKYSPYKLDGIVYHGVKSCRTASSGLADRRFHTSESLGLPTLLLESDIVDPRAVSKAQMKNRADAFFEGMIARKQKEAVAGH